MDIELQNLGNEMFNPALNNIEVCSYNYINSDENDDNFNNYLDDLISIFDGLFGFAATLGAFQFVGIIFEKSVVEDASEIVKLSYFFLALGFLFSILGALTVFLSSLYIRSLRQERKRFALVAIKRYSKLFYFGYITLFINSAAFLIPINILIHELLEFHYAIVINIFSLIILSTGVIIYVFILNNKQIFTYNDVVYQRKIYD